MPQPFYKIHYCLCVLCLIGTFSAMAQIGFFLPKGKSKVELPFEYVNNFIVVQVDYKGIFPLNFILDTGAEHTIMTKPEVALALQMEFDRSFTVLGSDMKTELTAFLVRRIPFTIDGKVEAPFHDILVLEKDYFQFEEHIGIPIHGILSARAFSRYFLQINYDAQVITLHARDRKKNFLKDYEKIELNMARNKPYIDTQVQLQNDTVVPIRLLLDTGAAISLLLFPESHAALEPPQNAIIGNIGKGLGGYLEGFTGRVEQLNLGTTFFQRGVVSFFQKIDTTERSQFLNNRNGIMGNVVLERFHLVFDYRNAALYVRPAKLYDKAYKYDKSGLHIIATGKNLHQYLIQSVLPNSPAGVADFQKGDQILSINRIPTKFLTLQGINKRLQKKEGKVLRIKVKRENQRIIKRITLRTLL